MSRLRHFVVLAENLDTFGTGVSRASTACTAQISPSSADRALLVPRSGFLLDKQLPVSKMGPMRECAAHTLCKLSSCTAK